MSNYDPNNPQEQGGMPPPPPPAYGNQGAYPQGQAPVPPAYGGMNAMPGSGYTPPAPMARPSAMDTAVKLMQAGGVLSILSLLATFLMMDTLRDEVTKQMKENDAGVSQSTIDAAVNVGLGVGILFGLLGAGLWFWMASANGKGKSWARIVATVFFVISLLSFLFSFTQTQPLISRVLSVLSILIGAAAMAMMWKKESSAYYNSMSAPKY